ncbi:cupin domain-containing protein [Haloparvum sp. AD34]
MEHVDADELEKRIMPAAVMKSLTEPLGTTDLAINYYELEPGDSFAFAYHDHEVQEEVFFVFEGTVTFETADGAVTVGPREALRVDRDELQRGWNRGDERVFAVALGAPLDYGDMTKLRYCPTCRAETDNELERLGPGADVEDMDVGEHEGEEAAIAVCTECGTTTGHWTEGSTPGEVD